MRLRLALPFAAALGCATGATHPATAPRFVATADSLAAQGDTTAALAVLDSAVSHNRRDAAAWHRNGMLTWALVRPTIRMGIPSTGRSIALMERADSALRLASRYAPDSARYHLELGRFFLHANVITLRMQAPAQFDKAAAAARRTGDSLLVAVALDESGMVHWRRYEAVAHRRDPKGGSTAGSEQLSKGTADMLAKLIGRSFEFSGELDYLNATSRFAQAQLANPYSALVARHRFMSLAERGHWEELERATDILLATDSLDASAWLANGVAQHRLRAVAKATTSFARGLSLLSPAERDRYTNISRLMRRADSIAYMAATPQSRDETNRMYWALADPLVMTTANENHLEFLSRVAYADLRWTSEDFDLRGADTDRGQVYVRYGPPTFILSFPPSTSGSEAQPGFGRIDWIYSGLSFTFRAPPGYGTASFGFDFKSTAESTRERVPASFRNVELVREMDSAAVQVARFRGPPDSVDLFVMAEIPLYRMTRGMDLDRGAIDVALAIYDAGARRTLWDSTRTIVRFDGAEPVEKRAWRQRYPAGQIAYRLEALQPAAMRGARALGAVNLTVNQGFGISDLVVGERIVPRDTATAARWSDMLIVPSSGTLRRGEAIGILWETYDLAAAKGVNRYSVELSLTVLDLDRSPETSPDKQKPTITTSIIGGIIDAIGLSAKGDDRVSLTYTREHEPKPVALNYLTVELGDAPRGRYRLRIEVTDLVSSRRATTERFLKVTR